MIDGEVQLRRERREVRRRRADERAKGAVEAAGGAIVERIVSLCATEASAASARRKRARAWSRFVTAQERAAGVKVD